MSNIIMQIRPYKIDGIWVFDDKTTGLVREPFVSGMGEIIDALLAGVSLPNSPENGFNLLFSSSPFPGYHISLTRQEPSMGGTWYFADVFKLRGWLCAALFLYFETAPEKLYVQAL